MDGTKFTLDKSKAASVLYFIIYMVACFVYWQVSKNHLQKNASELGTYTFPGNHPIVYTHANDLLKLAIHQNPNNVQLHSGLEALQKMEEAISSLEYYLRISYQKQPTNPTNLNNYARFLIELGKYSEAQEYLIKGVAASKAFGESEILLMATYHHSENWNQLQNLAEEVSRTKTSMLVAKKYLEIAKEKETVINILEKNLKNNPTPQNHLELSKELYNTKRFAESLHHARLALAKEKNLSTARLMLGLTYYKLGEKQDAIKALKSGLQFDTERQFIEQKLALLEYASNTALAYQ